MFDQNRDGEITKEELGAVLYALGQRPTVTEVQALIRSVDLDSRLTVVINRRILSYADKLCRQFGPRSGPTERRA